MTTRSPSKTVNKIMSIFIIFVLSACATATSAPPTETSILETSSTATATITPTNTPNVTPTQIPEVSPAAEGMGNVIGLVLWNDLPVVNAWVRACEELTLLVTYIRGFEDPLELNTIYDSFYFTCAGNKYDAHADENGYFVIKDVAPGKYHIVANLPKTPDKWIVNSEESVFYNVSAGENLILSPWSIQYNDLGVISPKIEQNLSEEKPIFKWDAYPDAAYYQISIYDEKDEWILENKRVDGNELTPDEPMAACKYYWYVEVFNSQGTKIAISDPPPSLDTPHWYLSLMDLPTSCEQRRDWLQCVLGATPQDRESVYPPPSGLPLPYNYSPLSTPSPPQ